jgi:hypothetical protein
MSDKYFITNVSTADTTMATMSTFGPYASEDIAKEVASFLQPGDWIIYGPCPAVTQMNISKPVITTKAMSRA